MPCDYSKYPSNWQQLRADALAAATGMLTYPTETLVEGAVASGNSYSYKYDATYERHEISIEQSGGKIYVEITNESKIPGDYISSADITITPDAARSVAAALNHYADLIEELQP